MKLKKGDEVIITVGKDKGKKAVIDRVFTKDNTVRLPGLNMFKRHVKKREGQHPGGIIDVARPIAVGKVAFVCKTCKATTRIGYKQTEGGKTRVCKKCGAVV